MINSNEMSEIKKVFTELIQSLSKQERHDLFVKMELADHLPYIDNIMECDRNWKEQHPNNSHIKPKIGLIGINVHVRTMNYACPLHAYAMQQYLMNKGYQVDFLDYVPNFNIFEEYYDYINPLTYYQSIKSAIEDELRNHEEDEELNTAFQRICQEIIIIEHNKDCISERAKHHFDFISKYLHLTQIQYNQENLEYIDPGYDVYICASDIIWDKFYAVAYDKAFFLNSSCMKNKWKIAYAASKWTKWTEQDFVETSELIKNIDFVSVRESFLQEELQRKVRHDVAWVVDPVLLNDPSLYKTLSVIPNEKKYVLLYCVVEQDPCLISEALKCVERLKSEDETCCLVVMTDHSVCLDIIEAPNIEIRYKYDAGINEWLGYILNAGFVYTNSFHGTCLCVLFQKDFYASKRNSYDKIGDFLEPIGLERRILNSAHIVPEHGRVANWSQVNEKLRERISESKLFLDNALSIASKPYPSE